MSWLLWSSLAFATQPAVIGAGEARSVVLLLAPGLEERSVRCDDLDGDGVWTCPAGELPAELDAVGLLLDGERLVQARELTLGEAPEAVVIERLGDTLRLSTRPLEPRAGGGTPRPGSAALLVEVRVDGESAPRLSVEGARGSVELACPDDGRFPDPVANDGARTCAGLVDDGELTLSLRLPGQAPRALGSLSWPPEIGLRQVRVDEQGAAVASWPILDRASMPRREDAPRVQGPPPGPGEPQQPGGPTPGALSGPDGLQLAISVLLALAVGGIAWRIGRGRPGAIPHARALPPPPILPGAPAGSLILRAPAGQGSALAGWLLPRLAQLRPVLVVDPALRAAPSPGPGSVILFSVSSDVDDVLDSVSAVAARAIVPPAVLARAGALSWAGGLGNTPEATLLAGLPSGAILVLVLEGEPAPAALPELTLSPHEGEWRAR